MRLLSLLPFLVGACAARELPPPPGPTFVDDLPEFDGEPGDLLKAHAHNDYYNDVPLISALEHRFYSVEVDVYLRDDRVVVAHYPFEDFGELDERYVDPIAALISQRGSAYGDGHPFTLWIDFKEDSDALAERVHEMLARHEEVFTSYVGDEVRSRPVVVVLTGAAVKERYVQRELRFALRDSNSITATDPPADVRWGYYALNYDDFISNPGDDLARDEQRITDVVRDAHDSGRKVRFYSAPDNEAAWGVQLRAGADFVGTDDLARLSSTLLVTQ